VKSVQFAMKENKIRDLHNFKRYCNWFWNDILIGDADLENEHETSILIIDDFFASFLAILEQPTPRRLDVEMLTQRRWRYLKSLLFEAVCMKYPSNQL